MYIIEIICISRARRNPPICIHYLPHMQQGAVVIHVLVHKCTHIDVHAYNQSVILHSIYEDGRDGPRNRQSL